MLFITVVRLTAAVRQSDIRKMICLIDEAGTGGACSSGTLTHSDDRKHSQTQDGPQAMSDDYEPAAKLRRADVAGDVIIPESASMVKMPSRRTQWTEDQKLAAVNRARQSRSIAKAARELKINPAQLGRWLHDADQASMKAREAQMSPREILAAELEALRCKRKERCGKHGLPEEGEFTVFLRIVAYRSRGLPLGLSHVSRIALAVSQSMKLSYDFMASYNWTRHFLKRYNFSKRRGTTGSVSEGLSEEDKAYWKRIYLARIAYIAENNKIPAALCFHADETGVELLPNSNYTLDHKGTRHVAISHMDEKKQATVMLGGNMAGLVLRPFIIFQGISSAKLLVQLEEDLMEHRENHEFPELEPISQGHSTSHWMNKDMAKIWVKEILLPAVREETAKKGLQSDHPFMLVWDVHSSHRHPDVLEWMKEEFPQVRFCFVPAKCTSFLQVVDVGMARPFKMSVTKQKEDWMRREVDVFEFGLDDEARQSELSAENAGPEDRSYEQDISLCGIDQTVTSTPEVPRPPSGGVHVDPAPYAAICTKAQALRKHFVAWVHEAAVHLQRIEACKKGVEQIGINHAFDRTAKGNRHACHKSTLVSWADIAFC